MASSSPEAVTLHIYELHADNNNQPSTATDALASADGRAQATPASRLLPFLRTVGLGTYHTSLQVRSKCYSFAAGVGIAHSGNPLTGAAGGADRCAPTNARYQESIELGSTTLSQGRINEVVNKLRSTTFTETSYHLMNRNCNHFTTTLALALLHGDEMAGDPTCHPKLDRYPAWVNRLARTGTGLGCLNGEGENDICDPEKEARVAVGADEKVGWDLGKGNAKSAAVDSKKGSGAGSNRGKKKELTEEQKKILAKLKTKG